MELYELVVEMVDGATAGATETSVDGSSADSSDGGGGMFLESAIFKKMDRRLYSTGALR